MPPRGRLRHSILPLCVRGGGGGGGRGGEAVSEGPGQGARSRGSKVGVWTREPPGARGQAAGWGPGVQAQGRRAAGTGQTSVPLRGGSWGWNVRRELPGGVVNSYLVEVSLFL